MSKIDDLDPIVAFIGVNDGANKGFWRIQPRDRSGQWIIMGAAVKAMFRDMKNDLKSIAGRYVGPTGRPGEARVLVRDEANVPDGVYTVQSHNLETFKAKLPESFLEEKGLPLDYTDSRGNERSISKNDLPSLEEFEATREDITPNDERLAEGELSEEEKEAEQSGREESPLAELPGGFESLNQDEAREMLRESGIDPDEFDPDAQEELDFDKDPVDTFVEEALFYGGPTRDIDEFLADTEKTSVKFPEELEPGDLIKLPDGVEVTAVNAIEAQPVDGLRRFDVEVIKPDGSRITFNVRRDQEMDVFDNRKGEITSPDQPEDVPGRPTPPPTAKPAKRQPYPERATMDTFLERAREMGREDDGGTIAPSTKSREELYKTKVKPVIDPATGRPLKIQYDVDDQGRPKYKTVQNPDAIMQQLLDDYPEAKINERGEIIVERQRFTDFDDTEYDYEISVAKTYGNGFLEKYKFTNVETGEEKEFYHYDYKDSYSSLHGKANGVIAFRDRILGRVMPGKEANEYYGDKNTLDMRIKFYRGKANNASLNNPNFKLLTQDELVRKYLDGRAQRLNMSTNPETGRPLLTQLQEEIPSFWDAADSGDKQARLERIISVLGRLPDNQLARSEMIATLRREVSARYNGTERGRPMATFANNLERAIKSGRFDINNLGRVPYASKDGNSRIEPGMRVRYTNNEGDESVGIVSALNPNTGPNEYHDTVRVKFANGQEVNILATKYMDIIDDDVELTDYTGRVEGEELVERRAERFGINLASYNDIFDPDEDIDGSTGERGPDGPEPDDLPPIGDFAPDGAADTPETEITSSITPGRVTVSDSQLASPEVGKSTNNFNTSQAVRDFLASDAVENDQFVRIESGSRKEQVAIKPTPAATTLKNDLVEQGLEVSDSIFSSSEYEDLRTRYLEASTQRKENFEKAREDLQNARSGMNKATDNYLNRRDEIIGELAKAPVSEDSRNKIDQIRGGNLEGFPELEDLAGKVREADEAYESVSKNVNLSLNPSAEETSALNELTNYRYNAIRSALEDQGIEFGGVTTKQLVDEGRLVFNGPRNIKKPGVQNSTSVQRQYEEQFDEILSFLPRNVIESIFSNESPLKVGVGTTRGHYSPSRNAVVLDVSKREGGDRSIFDTGIHELMHAAQTNNADIAALEHAWMFDRARGTNDRFPTASSMREYGSSERFINFADPTPSSYTQKTYSDSNVMFSFQNTEVSTTLMQGLFSNSKYIGLNYETGEYDKDAVAFIIGLLIGSGR